VVQIVLNRYIRGLEKLCTNISESIPLIPSLVGLKVLQLKYIFTGPSSYNLTDNSMIQIAHHCPLIVHLHVEHYTNLTDVSGVVIARDLHYLRTLFVDRCKFTSLTLTSLATHRADTLEILGTVSCDYVTSEGYSAVLQKCHKLHTVQLSTSHVVDYNSGWNNVTHLKLRCSSPEAAYTIMCNCSKLRHLEISYRIFDQIDFTVRFHLAPQLRVLKLLRGSMRYQVELRDKEDALLRDINAVRPELKIEFIDFETSIDVMKLPV
jgi:hypothetical protein